MEHGKPFGSMLSSEDRNAQVIELAETENPFVAAREESES